MTRLRIAQVSPLFEAVPPLRYGGTERIVAYLTEELVRQGHSVTLFASADSRTRARLVSVCHRALRLDPERHQWIPYHMLLLEEVLARAAEFDVVHFHIDLLHLPAARRLDVSHLTTLHGRLDLPELVPLYREFDDLPFVSISDAQRAPVPWMNWIGTVQHGLPERLYHAAPDGGRGGYLAFLGRISPEKGPERAIHIARASGIPLRIAAKVDPVDVEYFEEVVRPLLDPPFIEFVGEVTDHDKQAFLGDALALLFPIEWPEPFGLVLIEALACGTPVIAYRRGSVPEILVDGESGFVVDDLEGAVRAVRNLDRIERRLCRRAFERSFTVDKMAREYVRLYRSLVEASYAPSSRATDLSSSDGQPAQSV
jgi:glycosyltransferase involved in cell wall biosynthesis